MPRKTAGFSCMHGPENTFYLASPLGQLELVCCPKGIHKLHLLLESDDKFSPAEDVKVTIESQQYADNGYTYKSAIDCVSWLNYYFHNLPKLSSVQQPTICHLLRTSTCKSKTKASFTDRVWATLASDINSGCTVSYGNLAILSGGTSSASRAVGQAMRNNPVMIIVPCHRVILSSGSMGNYSGGTKNSVKAWLLKHEGI